MAYKLMSPLVSIILPSYNVGKYLQEAVESVINQTYTSYELLISDITFLKFGSMLLSPAFCVAHPNLPKEALVL